MWNPVLFRMLVPAIMVILLPVVVLLPVVFIPVVFMVVIPAMLRMLPVALRPSASEPDVRDHARRIQGPKAANPSEHEQGAHWPSCFYTPRIFSQGSGLRTEDHTSSRCLEDTAWCTGYHRVSPA